MKPKTMVLMIVAVTCGLGASYMTSRLLAEREEEPQQRSEILVAKKKINMGEVIKNPEDFFQKKSVLKEEEPPNAVVSFDNLKGKQIHRSLQVGDSVRLDDVGQDSGLGARLSDGYRAVGIRVTQESIAGGFASLPMSKVDIISTIRRADDKSSISQVLLQDVLVLAADVTTIREDNKAMPASVVTVALKPEDVVKIELAKQFGTLSLVLRRFGEKPAEHLAKATGETLITGVQVKDDEPAIIDNSQPPMFTPQPVPATPKEATPIDTRPLKKLRVCVTNGNDQKFFEYTFDDQDRVIECRECPPGYTGWLDQAEAKANPKN